MTGTCMLAEAQLHGELSQLPQLEGIHGGQTNLQGIVVRKCPEPSFYLFSSHSFSFPFKIHVKEGEERYGEMTRDDLGTVDKGTEVSHTALRGRSFVTSTASTASWHRGRSE